MLPLVPSCVQGPAAGVMRGGGDRARVPSLVSYRILTWISDPMESHGILENFMGSHGFARKPMATPMHFLRDFMGLSYR